jgi:hypothetical protein
MVTNTKPKFVFVAAERIIVLIVVDARRSDICNQSVQMPPRWLNQKSYYKKKIRRFIV